MEHLPVLKNEVVELLMPVAGVIVDATVGGGGHAAAIAAADFKGQNSDFRIIGIDQDHSALEQAVKKLKDYQNQITLVQDNFRNIKQILKELKIEKVGGILADLGVSSLQLDDPARGFSFQHNAPLDMRMNQNQKYNLKFKNILKSKIYNLKSGITAWQIIHTWDERKLADIFWRYGEERFARKIAHAVRLRRKEINSTQDLAELVKKCIPPRFRKHKIHPATKTFQALRIAVNDEIEALKDFLADAPELLAPGGRLIVISFHSLEDRLVKQKFNQLKTEGYDLLTRHPIIASADEVAKNPHSRSAKLRAIEKIYDL